MTRRHLLTIAATALTGIVVVVPAVRATAEVDDTAPYIESMTYGGSGCPQGSVGQSISNTRTSATLIFDSFVASHASATPITENRKNCELGVKIHAPATGGDVCLNVQYRGYVSLAADAGATRSTLAFWDADPVDTDAQSFAGPLSRDYLALDDLVLPYEDVGESMLARIDAAVRIQSNSPSSSQITTDSIDLRVAHCGNAPALERPYIAGLAYQGTGCPAGSVGQSISTSRRSATLIFDAFVALAPPGAGKDCALDVTITVPPQPGRICVVVQHRGYAQVPVGGSATMNTNYLWRGASVAEGNESFAGPVSHDYLHIDEVPLRHSGGSSDHVLTIETSVVVDGVNTQATVDSIDLRLAACSTSVDFTAPHIRSISYGGTGCPQGTVSSSFANDRRFAALAFDQWIALTGPGIPVTEARKTCQINLTVALPDGPRPLCLAVGEHGYTQLTAGATLTRRSIVYLQGGPIADSSGVSTGPLAADHVDRSFIGAMSSDEQVQTVNLNSTIQLNGPGAKTLATVDGLDFEILDSCDVTPPVVTATPSVEPNANGWNNTDVVVSFECTDDDSGVDAAASTLGDVTLTASGTATGTCVDNAGNQATASYTAQIDKVAPTASITSPVSGGMYGLGATVASVFTCHDDLSGIDSCSGPATLTTSALGSTTFSVAATDLAGNGSTTSVTYVVGGKNDCKNNGYKAFLVPAFKNQGQCVSSFVP